MEVGYLDESGFSLTLPPTYSWSREGRPGVPRAWGSRGRVNVVGHLVRGRGGAAVLCRFGGAGAVGGGAGVPGRGGGRFDQAFEGVHGQCVLSPVAGDGGEEGGVEGAGAYGGIPAPVQSPFEPMEGVWRRVKGFLMPRRHYGGVEELREAVVQALKALGGVELKILGEGT